MASFAEVFLAFLLFGLGATVGSLVALARCARRIRGFKCTEEELERLRDEVWELKSAAAALDKAEAANEAKSRFLATVSHEVRTPLNGILGITDLLASTSLTPEQSSYLDAIRASGASLSSLINEILDISKIEAGKLELVAAPFDLAALVEGVVELLAPRAQGKGLEIACFVAAEAPRMVVGDAGRLRQILINLAGNAVKFTQIGGVGLRVTLLPEGRLRFSVCDTGPGVPLARRQAIFQDFEQADNSSTRQHEGTGLGLAISRRIVDLMGGELRLEQTSDEGSIFAFAIALPTASNQPDKSFNQDLGGKRALVVAASPFCGPYLGERLSEFGAEVIRAQGEAAAMASLQRIHGSPPDIVIVDCALGEAV